MAKALIMLVRLLGLAAIIVGSLLWITNHQSYLPAHIGLGFCVAAAVFVMGVIALTRGAVGPGIMGIVLALLLPVVGFMQLPLAFHSMGVVQVAHLAIALTVLGLAERLHSTIHRAG